MSKRTPEPHWEHFDHGADIGVRGVAATLAGAFEQAALAMTAVVTSLDRIAPESPVAIECQNRDPELLLVDWLNSLVFEMATRQMLFNRFRVDINGNRLTATAWGERVEVERHHPAVEVKGATYTALQVVLNDDNRWVAQTVVDV